jgi:centromere protein J
MKFPKEYHSKTPQNTKVVEQVIGNDGKIQRVYENGKKEVIFNNGVKREVFPDGYTIVYFNNNDIKQTYAD